MHPFLVVHISPFIFEHTYVTSDAFLPFHVGHIFTQFFLISAFPSYSHSIMTPEVWTQ
jgi:hypothetical protein